MAVTHAVVVVVVMAGVEVVALGHQAAPAATPFRTTVSPAKAAALVFRRPVPPDGEDRLPRLVGTRRPVMASPCLVVILPLAHRPGLATPRHLGHEVSPTRGPSLVTPNVVDVALGEEVGPGVPA